MARAENADLNKEAPATVPIIETAMARGQKTRSHPKESRTKVLQLNKTDSHRPSFTALCVLFPYHKTLTSHHRLNAT